MDKIVEIKGEALSAKQIEIIENSFNESISEDVVEAIRRLYADAAYRFIAGLPPLPPK